LERIFKLYKSAVPMKGFNELVASLNQISGKWIPSHRTHDTGIGKTLEDLLGIPENNFPGPNGERVELKSMRKGSNSMLTLFTKAPKPLSGTKELLTNIGYPDSERGNRNVLHFDLYGNRLASVRSGHQIGLKIGDDYISIIDENNHSYCGWTYLDLNSAFEKKLHRILLVKADSRFQNGREEFNYNEAWVLMGFSFERFISLIKQGIVKIELRLGLYENGRLHDHGTGFRVKESNLQDCFAYRDRIL
jgi:hypothetical protein